MTAPRQLVVVGATSLIAQWCVRVWLEQRPARVVLAGRDARRLEEVAEDLRVRSPASEIATQVLDFHEPARIAAGVAQACGEGTPDIVLIAHGALPDQGACEAEPGRVDAALRINAVSPALFAEAFAGRFAAAGRGTLVLIGSVAGDRGRKSNYVYGSAKALLDRYAQGLQHRFAGSDVKVVLVKPGPIDTPMTANTPAHRLASPEDAARRIVAGVARGAPVVYAPARWRLIMFVIRHLPRAIFNRLDI